jgi:N-methylhydantoinase A
MGLRLGVDIGGTFTDFIVADDEGVRLLWKEDSRPDEPVAAIMAGLRNIADQLGRTLEQLLGEVEQFVHGTTIATNAIIQRRGPRLGLVCTDGFRDILYFRDGFKPERFNVHLAHPGQLVERFLRIGVRERVNFEGEVLTPLVEGDVRQAAATFREAHVGAVAVAFMWSVVNPDHERRAAKIMRAELPDVPVVCSVDVLPEIREWERTSATALSAFVLPAIQDYLAELEAVLERNGYRRPLLIMQNNGGCASVAEVLRQPVNILASGPAAAPAASLILADSVGTRNIITGDMGGTSFDVCVIRDGRAAMSRHVQVADQPIGVPAIEVHSIGAGGGSIAWVDDGGVLRVGPQSAGARPGPGCYDRGGTLPTVTDANVVLGYLEPDAFLGGRRVLRKDLATAAIEAEVGRPLGLTASQAALGIIRVVNSVMSAGMRAVSVERGIDPRTFLMVSGGGAGGLHAASLARELGIRRVLIPKEASALCAFGLTVTDVRHDAATSLYQRSDDLDVARINLLYDALEREAVSRLHAEGFDDQAIIVERFVDARYANQIHELTIKVPRRGAYVEDDVTTFSDAFHDDHQRIYSYSLPEAPIEFLHWRLTAIGQAHRDTSRLRSPTTGHPRVDGSWEQRLVVTERAPEGIEIAFVRHDLLTPDVELAGPAVVQLPTTTVLINADDVLRVARDGSFLIDIAKLAPTEPSVARSFAGA